MNSAILSKLGLILGISSKFIADAVSKSAIISQVLSEGILEFGLHYWNTLRATFLLVLVLYYWSTKEQSGKYNALGPAGFSRAKVIFNTTDKSNSSPGKNSHNKGRGTGSLAVALKYLLKLEQKVGSDSGSGSGFDFLNRLSWTIRKTLR